MSKIRSGKPVAGTQFGTTLSNSHNVSFNKGNFGGSAPNGIVPQKAGPTITCNDPAINFPKASTSPKATKVVKSGSAKGYVPNGSGSLSKNDTMVK